MQNYHKKEYHFFNDDFMKQAIEQASIAYDNDEIPIGCVIVDLNNNHVIAKAHNQCQKENQSIKHAELIAIEAAMQIQNKKYLTNCAIYVSMQPCSMCMGAINLAKISKLYYATDNQNIYHHNNKIEIYSHICEEESKKLLHQFFTKIRSNSNL